MQLRSDAATQPYLEKKRILPGGLDGSISCFTVGSSDGKLYVPPHFHEYIEFIFVRRGCMKVLLDNRYQPVTQGMLAVIESGQVHATLMEPDDNTRCTVIKFEPELFASAFYEMGQLLSAEDRRFLHPAIYSQQELSESDLPKQIAAVLSEFENKEYGYDLAVKSGIGGIYLWILRKRYPKQIQERMRRLFGQPQWSRIQQVIRYVGEHYEQELSAEDIAKEFSMSYSYFSRQFRQISGHTFKEYLNLVRVNEAEKLLLTTDLSVTEAALRCGYSSTSYFIRQFRLHRQYSPRQFLKAVRDAQNIQNGSADE